MMFSDIVLELDRKKFDGIFNEAKKAAGVQEDADLTAEALRGVVRDFKALVKSERTMTFPTSRCSSWSLRSAPSSTPGTTSARSGTGNREDPA